MQDTSRLRADTRPQAFMTATDLAERWHCSVGWLGNLRSRGQGPPFVKIGAKVLYALDAVEAFEARGQVQTVTI